MPRKNPRPAARKQLMLLRQRIEAKAAPRRYYLDIEAYDNALFSAFAKRAYLPPITTFVKEIR